jgi:hypothetical protein
MVFEHDYADLWMLRMRLDKLILIIEASVQSGSDNKELLPPVCKQAL